MEKDAVLKANKEVMFHKGDSYQKTVGGIASVLNDGGVSLRIPDNVVASGRAISYEYLIKCLVFDYRSQSTICELVKDGIFDVLGLEKEKRPDFTLLAPVKHALENDSRSLGHYFTRSYSEDLLSEGNGSILVSPNVCAGKFQNIPI